MKTILIGLSILGLTSLTNAQNSPQVKDVHLDEVALSPIKNASYYNSVYDPHASYKVTSLEQQASNYDVTHSEIYHTPYDSYQLMFTTNKGEIIANYDKNGELVSSLERFRNVKFPEAVRKTLSRDYPDWSLNSTSYRVSYFKNKACKKVYNLQLKKDNDKINLKIDCQGNILRSSE